jgi:hypothetical protein
LSAWLFLLPLAVGLMLATWLRAPGWIAGQNGWRAWVKPIIPIVGALAFVGILLPEARLAQVRHAPSQMLRESDRAALDKTHQAEANATAELYLKAAQMLQAPLADDPLAPWSGPEYEGPTLLGGPGGIDETKIPPDQMEAYEAAKKKSEAEWKRQHAEAIELAIEASQRPTCHFSFPISALEPGRHVFENWPVEFGKTYDDLNWLLTQLVSLPKDGVEGDVHFEQFLAGLRMSSHIRSGQPTVILNLQLKREQEILRRIGDWAASKERTNDERRTAIAKIQEYFATPPDMASALLADRRLIRRVIEGLDLPLMVNVAFLANRLPWERERALAALDIITDQNLWSAQQLTELLQGTRADEHGNAALRNWLRPAYERPEWMLQRPQTTTSYMASKEYVARVPVNALFREYCDTITYRRAVLLEIALAMYRHDHKEYPAALSAVAPIYLDREPFDPYALQPFSYLPDGLDELLLHNGPAQPKRIAAHTPFFWSVGPNNRRLYRPGRMTDAIGAEMAATGEPGMVDQLSPSADPAAEAGAITEPAVVGPHFVQEGNLNWIIDEGMDLVFPLPK